MRIFFAFIITCGIGCVFTNDAVIVNCVTCKHGGSILQGEVDEDLTISYTVKVRSFKVLEVRLNGTENQIIRLFGYHESGRKSAGVSDRFIVHDPKASSPSTLTFTITKLSLYDDSMLLKYILVPGTADSKGENTVTVVAVPTFCVPLQKDYTIDIANTFHAEFSLCGNPQPTTVKAKFGGNDLAVGETVKGWFRYGYQVRGNLMKEWCGEKLEVTAIGHGTTSATANVKMSFVPDPPTRVIVYRDKSNLLIVRWSEVAYGNCGARYHVRYHDKNVTKEHLTTELEWRRQNSIGNISVAVNAEVNGIGSQYSKTTFITEIPEPVTKAPTTKGEESPLSLEYIIIIVVVVTLMVVIVIGVCILKRRRGRMAGNAGYGVGLQPLEGGDPVPKPH